MRIALDGKTISFSAMVGVDDSLHEHERQKASSAFFVYVDHADDGMVGIAPLGFDYER